MIKNTLWSCGDELIKLALSNHLNDTDSVVLNEPTGNFFYDSWRIKDEFKDTAWQSILETIPCGIGQARIIKLMPGESYQAHADIDNRWHLNLTGNQSFLIDLESKKMYECKQDNTWYYMDAGKIHAATNYGATPRLQLVVRELLHKPHAINHLVLISIEPSAEQSSFRYKFDNLISPWLNKMNKSYKLMDFSHSTNSVNFKLDPECVQELRELIADDYKLIIHAS